MAIFVIDGGGEIKMALRGNRTKRGGESFASKEELEKLAGKWPGRRLVEIWNRIPGVAPVRKFTDRKTAIGRNWNALEPLRSRPSVSTADQPKASRKTKSDSGTTRQTRRIPSGSKKAAILKMLRTTRWRYAGNAGASYRVAGTQRARLHQCRRQ